MNWKIGIIALLAIMLLSSASAATITTTWNKPSSGMTYNNTPLNRQTIDLNFGWTDNNSDQGSDMNIDYLKVIRQRTWATVYTLKEDTNAFVATGTNWICTKNGPAAINGSCNYTWTMPTNTDLPDDTYCLDVNVVSYYEGDTRSETEGDKNALRCFTINNGFAMAAQTRAMMAPVAIILIAAVMLAAVISITALGTDPAKTLGAAVVAAIAVAVIVMVIGNILSMI